MEVVCEGQDENGLWFAFVKFTNGSIVEFTSHKELDDFEWKALAMRAAQSNIEVEEGK